MRNQKWVLPEKIWKYMEPLIPEKEGVTEKGGRPPLPPRKVAEGIFYVLATGCQWKAVPEKFVSGSSLHKYFQEWQEAGVFSALWKRGLMKYDSSKKIKWKWQSIDSSAVKSPLGGKKNRGKPNRSWKAGYEAFCYDRCRRGTPVTGVRRGPSAR